MILSFSTKFKNGKPTNFVGKIWTGLFPIMDHSIDEWFPIIKECREKELIPLGEKIIDSIGEFKGKLHTIREDKHNRWHAGVLIHFTVFPRSSKMFQFAPVIPCKSVQKIEISYLPARGWASILLPKPVSISIDNRFLESTKEVKQLAQNDGFDSVDDFFDWFKTDFTGKIIHWTDLKY